MAMVCQKHQSSQAISRLVSEIVFKPEFTSLWEELAEIYKASSLANYQQEAFQDAFYAIYTERERGAKALPLQG